MLATSLLVVHNTSRGGEDDVTELTGRQKVGHPLLDVTNADVESRRDNTALVKTSVQLNDNLSRSVVIDVLKVVNVSCELVTVFTCKQ